MGLFQLDFFLYMLIIMLIIGAVLVVATSLGFGKSAEDEKDIAEKLDVLENSVADADELITELNDKSKNVMKEFENKYQELLFLYNLIDEKQKNIGDGFVSPIKPKTSGGVDIVIDDSSKAGSMLNPKFANVLQMSRDGKSVEEIAKHLNMGKGEVGLILTFGGGGKNA